MRGNGSSQRERRKRGRAPLPVDWDSSTAVATRHPPPKELNLVQSWKAEGWKRGGNRKHARVERPFGLLPQVGNVFTFGELGLLLSDCPVNQPARGELRLLWLGGCIIGVRGKWSWRALAPSF